MGKLRDQMQADLQLRGLSPKTQKIYLAQVRDFAHYFFNSQTILRCTEFSLLKFSATENLKHRAILILIYSSGLRVSEAVHLKISDIDSKRMMVRIQQRKGDKDRYSTLSNVALDVLRQYRRKQPFKGTEGVLRYLGRYTHRVAIGKFLLHVLPDRFAKIRYYGLLGNRNRRAILSRCRKLLGVIIVELSPLKQLTGVPLKHGRNSY